ncbi:MAG: methyl-accepting chemotaxis protein [Herbinix sp.]|jgi:methyl-accepting chemotaxis protein|nr:methyl-accepting chemotaxis protein [Herbinix sp.]
MKITTKFGGMMIGIMATTGLLMFFILSGLSNIITIINDQQNYHSPIMIESLSLQKDIIQIQQWLTDISATRAKEGFDDGYEEAENYYQTAKDKLQHLLELGVEEQVITNIDQNLNDYYQMGKEMAAAYIKEGTDAGNAFMEKFDPFAIEMEKSVNVLLEEADNNYSEGNQRISVHVGTLYQTSIILFVMVIIIVGISFYTIYKSVIRRIHTVTNLVKEISEGDGDLTKRIEIQSNDEIGSMTKYFNNFIQTVHKIVASVSLMSYEITKASDELLVSSEQSAATSEDVAQAINEIAKSTTYQAQNTLEGSNKLVQLGDLIEDSKDHIGKVTAISEKVDELVEQGLSAVESLAEKTKESSNATANIYKSILRTKESSESIGEASNIITSIAKRTNLIALNASIEASRAGEYGKSFQVVAEEIRKLAEQSAAATKMIDTMVGSLQEDVTNSVEIMKDVEIISNQLQENVAFTDRKYKEITKAVKMSSDQVQEVFELAKQMEAYKNIVLGIMETLSSVAQQNAAGSQEASASMEEQTATILQIAESTSTMAKSLHELKILIEGFKVE